jgi:hypothetical protein
MTESFWSWLSSSAERKLTQEEIDRYLGAVEEQVPLLPGENADARCATSPAPRPARQAA